MALVTTETAPVDDRTLPDREAVARAGSGIDVVSAVTWTAILVYVLACLGAVAWVVGSALQLW
jgi:hypothetical protein